MNEWIGLAAVPVAGWIISVERRLASLGQIEKKVDQVDSKVDKVIDHLIGRNPHEIKVDRHPHR